MLRLRLHSRAAERGPDSVWAAGGNAARRRAGGGGKVGTARVGCSTATGLRGGVHAATAMKRHQIQRWRAVAVGVDAHTAGIQVTARAGVGEAGHVGAELRPRADAASAERRAKHTHPDASNAK